MRSLKIVGLFMIFFGFLSGILIIISALNILKLQAGEPIFWGLFIICFFGGFCILLIGSENIKKVLTWNGWMLFFFGIIALSSIFANAIGIINKIEKIPFWIMFIMGILFGSILITVAEKTQNRDNIKLKNIITTILAMILIFLILIVVNKEYLIKESNTNFNDTFSSTNLFIDEKIPKKKIYFKLPLEHIKFHWDFLDKKKFLSGYLKLYITRSQKTEELTIFQNGQISKEWMPIGTAGNTIYFGFISQKVFRVLESDEIKIILNVTRDIPGMGENFKGILKKGIYSSIYIVELYSEENDTIFLRRHDIT